MDLLDLLDEPRGPRASAKVSAPAPGAPVELMSQFLLLITEGRMSQALLMCDEILLYEPNNKMIRDYRTSLTKYIDQGLESDSDDSTESEDGEEDGEEKASGSESEGESSGHDEPAALCPPAAESKSTNAAPPDAKLTYSFARVKLEERQHKK